MQEITTRFDASGLSPTSGSFRLAFNNAGRSNLDPEMGTTTGFIPFNASASTLHRALESLSSIGTNGIHRVYVFRDGDSYMSRFMY